MKHWKETPDGRDEVEQVNCDPPVPLTPEELARAGGGGGGAKGVPPEDAGGGVVVENFMMTLPEHPRGEGWLK